MNELTADGVISSGAPFATELDWVYFELWRHEGRRARHGASMMGPDYTHWHGMYEVAHNFYNEFLPLVVEEAEHHSATMGRKWKTRIDELLASPNRVWTKGLSPEQAQALAAEYKARYNQ